MTQIILPVCVTASTCLGWRRTRAPPQPAGTQGLVVLHALKGILTWKLLFILTMIWNLRLKINFPRSVTSMSQDNNVKFLKAKFIKRNYLKGMIRTATNLTGYDPIHKRSDIFHATAILVRLLIQNSYSYSLQIFLYFPWLSFSQFSIFRCS